MMTEREEKAFDAIVAAMKAVIEVDERGPLQWNLEEVTAAVHVLQSFVSQHILWRQNPEFFSDWWEIREEALVTG